MQETRSDAGGVPVVGAPREALRGVRSIAVLRAGGLGDLLFTLPAMRALGAAYPDAAITLLGSRPAAELLRHRERAPHRVVELPPVPGVGVAPGAEADDARIDAFVEEQRRERYDLAVQMHGGGGFSNPLLLRLGAACTIGTRAPGAARLDRSIDYDVSQNEVLRWLEVVGLVGAVPCELEPRVDPTERELEFGRRLVGEGRPVVAVHPGATDPRRRWPARSFAELTASLMAEGVRVVLVGGEDDRSLCARIAAEAGGAEAADLLVDTAGRLSLPQTLGVLAACDAMVGNDSGPRHLAQAAGTPTVSIFWCGNLLNAGPFGREQHRVHVSWTTRCPVCGADCTPAAEEALRCAHDVSFVAGIAVGAVLDDVRRLLG